MTAELGPGSHAVVATYSGDAVYAAASASMTESVTSPAGTITLTANPASPVYGEPITLTAGSGGTVQFADGGAPLGVGEGAITVSRLAAGTHTITATAGTASAELVLTVAKARTTTSVRVSDGQAAAQVVAVAPGSGVPTGPVRFADSATGRAFAVVSLETGTASAALPAGVSLATAAYEGDANFSASVSGAAGMLTVLNAGSYDGAGFAAGEIVTVFGSNLAGTVRVTDSAGVARGADVLYGSATQMSLVLPDGMASGVATLTVGGMSAALPVGRTAPGLFTVDASGKGVAAAQVVTVHADGTQDAGSADAIEVGGAGDAVYLILYGTGVRHFADRVVCTVAGRPATVAFAGAQSGSAGLDQVNVLLPAELKGAGRVELVVTADGVASNAVTVVFR
jgi:large repetitive protein